MAHSPPPVDSGLDDEKEPKVVKTPALGKTGVVWQDQLFDTMISQTRALAKEGGMNADMAEAYVRISWGGLLDYIGKDIFGRAQVSLYGDANLTMTNTAEGLQKLAGIGMNWIAARIPGFSGLTIGGGGARGPTSAEIRQSFDVGQLAGRAGDLWRGYLVEEPQDARGLARAYVDAVVRSGAEQKIDFDTFVVDRIKATPRYAVMSKNKPKGMDYMNYIAPFVGSAQEILGGNQGRGGISQVVMSAAGLGSDPQSFRERLKRSDTVTGSSGYINSLTEKTSGISRVLK
jgi:hypothetical protein